MRSARGSGRFGRCRVRAGAHALARRGDRVAQLRATRPRRAARPRGTRELLDADVHQLAAPTALSPRVVARLPRRRIDRDRSPHARVRVRARNRPSARQRRSERSTTPSHWTMTTRSGAPSPTTTGRRSTSSTGTASSATSTSARDATSDRSVSSSGCSALSATASPSQVWAWRRRPTGTI